MTVDLRIHSCEKAIHSNVSRAQAASAGGVEGRLAKKSERTRPPAMAETSSGRDCKQAVDGGKPASSVTLDSDSVFFSLVNISTFGSRYLRRKYKVKQKKGPNNSLGLRYSRPIRIRPYSWLFSWLKFQKCHMQYNEDQRSSLVIGPGAPESARYCRPS